MTGTDVLRLVVLAPLCLVGGATVAILRLYWHAYRQLPPSRARLTPLHVSLVSLGTLMLAAGLGWAILTRYGDGHPFDLPAILRLGMYGVGSVCILAALCVIGSVQRRRIRFGRGCTTVDVHPAPEDDTSGS